MCPYSVLSVLSISPGGYSHYVLELDLVREWGSLTLAASGKRLSPPCGRGVTTRRLVTL